MSHIIKLLKALDVTAQTTETMEPDLSSHAAVFPGPLQWWGFLCSSSCTAFGTLVAPEQSWSPSERPHPAPHVCASGR